MDKRLLGYINWALLACMLLLYFTGVANLYSASGTRVETGFAFESFYQRQLVWGLCGLGCMLLATLFDYRQLRNLAWPAYLLFLVLLMLVPILYWKMANGQFRRLLKNSWQWNREADKAWWEEFKAFLRHPVGKVLPHWREFNPYHKFWVCYLCVAIPLLAVTGIINFFSPTMPGEGGWAVFYAIHSLVALCTDLLIITHLYFKLLRFLIRTTADMYKSWKKTGTFHYPFIYDQKKSS